MLDFQDAVRFSNYGQKTVGAVALVMQSIPSAGLFDAAGRDATSYAKNAFAMLLSEYSKENLGHDTSFEMIWYSSQGVGGTEIKLILILRAVGNSEDYCRSVLLKSAGSVSAALARLKFAASYTEIGDYLRILNSLDKNELFTIRRRDEIVGFNTNVFPYCYKYDPVNENDCELDMLLCEMAENVGSAFIMQVIPTYYSDSEKIYISNCLNSLSKISQGIFLPGVGFYQDARAELPLRVYKKYFDRISSPQLMLNLIVSTPLSQRGRLTSQVVSLMNGGSAEQRTNFEICDITGSGAALQNPYASPWLLSDENIKSQRNYQLMSLPIWQSIYRLASIYTPSEVSQVFRLPIGSERVSGILPVHNVEKKNKRFAEGIVNSPNAVLGRLKNVIGMEGFSIGVEPSSLSNHTFISGDGRSGKSGLIISLAEKCYKDFNIPFLAIEPNSKGFRALFDIIPNMQVLTVTKGGILPINPFVPPCNVTVGEYKQTLKALFVSSLTLRQPADRIFEEAMDICYSECGYLDGDTVVENKRIFSLWELIRTYKELLRQGRYYPEEEGEAGLSALISLAEDNRKLFDSEYSISLDCILSRPTVIELSGVKDAGHKSFLMMLLLSRITLHAEKHCASRGELKHLVFVEDAAAFVGNKDTRQSGEVLGRLSDMLAKMRGRGVGVILSDKSPSLFGSNFISSLGTHVAFNHGNEDDRMAVSAALGLTSIQKQRLSSLKEGEAFVSFRKLDEAEEIETLQADPSGEISDGDISGRTFINMSLKLYDDCEYISACNNGCSPSRAENARAVAERIFRRSYPSKFNDIRSFAEFFKGIDRIIAEESLFLLKDPNAAKNISHCVKLHLLRRIHYSTEAEIDLKRRKRIYKKLSSNS